MLDIKKLVNLKGDEIFYLATDKGAIEVSLRNGCDIYWNFIGLKYDRYSRDEVTVRIALEDNDIVYYMFEKMFYVISDLDVRIKSGMLSHCYVGDDAIKVLDNNKIVWQSDDVISSNANSLIISKEEDCYYVTFRKSKNMDGYLNRSYRVKIKNIGCRNAPMNMAFMDFYKDLLKIDDVEKKDQKAYMLSKKMECPVVVQ